MNRLTKRFGGDDFECPHCNKWIDVEWDSESGEPDIGEHVGECPHCEKSIGFYVYHVYRGFKV